MSYAKNISKELSKLFYKTAELRRLGIKKRRASASRYEAKICRYYDKATKIEKHLSEKVLHSRPPEKFGGVEANFISFDESKFITQEDISVTLKSSCGTVSVTTFAEDSAPAGKDWYKLNISKHPKTSLYTAKVTSTEKPELFVKATGFEELESARMSVQALKTKLAEMVGRA